MNKNTTGRRLLAAAALTALAGLATTAQAAGTVVFSDDFNGNTTSFLGGLGQQPGGWSVTGGSVDLVGSGTVTPLNAVNAGHGKFIDLDGSSFNAGLLSRSLSLQAGTTYTLSFDLAGQNRSRLAGRDSVTVSFGDVAQTFSLAWNAGWNQFSLVFTPTASQAFSLSFANAGGDNLGALLDNVSVTAAVPEPQTYAMLLGGLLAIGAVARRRKQQR